MSEKAKRYKEMYKRGLITEERIRDYQKLGILTKEEVIWILNDGNK